MKYNDRLAKDLKKEFDFNNYEIDKDKLIDVVNIIDGLFKDDFMLLDQFLKDLHSGKLGMWYKQPVSILSLANKFVESSKNTDFTDPLIKREAK